MNFSSLRDIFLIWHLRILGYQDPHESPIPLAFPQPSPRKVTCQDVQDRLKALPDLKQLKALQASQKKAKATGVVATTLKAFCQCAGEPLIRAFEILETLRGELELLSPETSTSQPFSLYQAFKDALLEIRMVHAVWEVSVGNEAFFKRHAQSRAVRHEYLWFMLQLVYTVSDLTFPDEFHANLEGLERLLERQDWREQLILDSEVTYGLSKKKARPGIIAPPDQFPARFLPHGMTVLRPHVVHNPSLYGHRLVPNACSLRHRQGAPGMQSVCLNMGRLNNWDQE